MNDNEVRLACLRLAAEILTGGKSDAVLALAGQLYDFVRTGNLG